MVALAGCNTSTGTVLDNKTAQGAIIGTLAGAAVGGAADGGKGALIGAAVGGVAGGLIGNYMGKQKDEIDAIPDANVERRADESLVVLFPGDVLFDTGSATLQPGAYSRLRTLADTLRRNPETNIIVRGHTAPGSDEQESVRLSLERAEAVSDYLTSVHTLNPRRFRAEGYGSQAPPEKKPGENPRQYRYRLSRVEIILVESNPL